MNRGRVTLSMLLLPLTARILGAQWIPQASGTDAEFRGLSVVSATAAWASGTHGRVAHTTDGGATWVVDTVPGAEQLDLRDIEVKGDRIWTVSSGPAEQGQARIFASQDGGATWAVRFATSERGVFLDALAFWDADHGIAMSDPVGGKLFLFVTDDGGITWERVPPDSLPEMLPNEAAFAASGTCMTVEGTSNVWIATGGAARARVFRSNDRGRSWKVADTPIHAGNSSSGIFSIAFADRWHGIAVGGDYQKPDDATNNVAITFNGGRNWQLASGPLPPGYMSSAAYLPGTRGGSLIAVGLAGTARSIDGGMSWTMIDTTAYNTVAFFGVDHGWAVGPRGRISKWAGTMGSRLRVRKPKR